MTTIKIFLETSVIIGAVQQNLIMQDYYLLDLLKRNLIKKSESYQYSKEFVDYILSGKNKDIEPLTSYYVKYEIRNLMSKKDQLEGKIISKLKLLKEIKKLPIEDQKNINILLYRIFLIQLPSLTYDLIDSMTSISVDMNAVEMKRDEIFMKVYRPLLGKLNYLKDYFELKGLPEKDLMKDARYPEYLRLKKVLKTFEDFPNYKRITDLLILGEAIVIFNKLETEMKEVPDFYFVSCDSIFIPYDYFFDIKNSIERNFKIRVGTSKFFLEELTHT